MTTETTRNDYKIQVVRSAARRATISLRYAGQGVFVISVPVSTPESFIDAFLAQRRNWIEKTWGKVREHDRQRTLSHGSRIETEFYTLVALSDDRLAFPQYRVERQTAQRQSIFHLAAGFFAAETQPRLWHSLEKYLLAQLVAYGSQSLIERTHYWARQHKIHVREVFVKAQKSRLGYCTHDDRIMLNARLLLAPQQIRDYVIHHELAHTRHRNHSKQYWSYLEQLFPGARTVDKALRDTSLYSMRVTEQRKAEAT